MKKYLCLTIAVCMWIALAGCAASERVTTDGSTSMNKVIGALGEAFENETGVAVTFNATGSGAGIQAVLEGRCDIGLSSRALKESETAKGLVGTVLAYDGIVVIVHPQNPLSDLSLEDIAAVFTGAIQNWKEIGGFDREIVRIGREAGSGTRDGFETATNTVGECAYRQELTSSGDVITAVSQNPAAIGYTSLASVKGTVKAVTVDGVAANDATVKEGSYTVRRPFLLVTKRDTPLTAQAQRFFDYATSAEAEKILAFAGVVSPH